MKAEKKNRAVWGVLLLVCVFFLVLMGFASYTVKSFKSQSLDFQADNSKAPIGVIEIDGIIMDSKKIVDLIHKAEKDKSIKAIILRINSPGGAVGPTQEIYEEIRRIDSSKEGKPIIASFGAIAASGGYYVGAAARKIYSNPGTLTGSIGVIMEFVDLSKLYQFAKIRQQTVKAGQFKDMGHPSRGLNASEKKLMDNLLQGVHQQFINDILNLRKKKLKKDINDVAQGQIFSGEMAYQYGLVDQLGSLWKAGRDLHTELDLKGEFGLRFIKEKKKLTFWEIMENLDEAVSSFNLKSLVEGAPLLLFRI